MKHKQEHKEHKKQAHHKPEEKHKVEHAEKKIHEKQKHNHGFSAEFKHCLHSFKELKSVKALVVASFDVLFYILMFVFTLLFSYMSNLISNPLNAVDPNALLSSTAEQIGDTKVMMTRILVLLFIAVFIYLLLVLLSFVLSRYLIWTTLLNKKMDLKVYFKFVLLNAIWIFCVVIIAVVLLLPLKVMQSQVVIMLYSIIFAVFTIIVMYFTYLMYYTFTEKNLVFHSIKNSLVSGITRLRKLWFPVALILVVFVIATIISLPTNWLPKIAEDIFAGILLVVFLTWVKIYSVSVMQRTNITNISD